MSLFLPQGYANSGLARQVSPGDVMAGGEVFSPITTVGAGLWTGAAIGTGLIQRSGPTGAYTDTTDTAANIIQALTPNISPNAAPGQTFRLRVMNTVAFAMTFAAGAGVVAGTKGTGNLNMIASSWKDYLLTLINVNPPEALNGIFVTGSPNISFYLQPGQTSLPLIGPQGVTVVPGMTLTGTGIPAGTTVIGVTQGQGGLVGCVISQNTTANSATPAGNGLVFTGTVEIDALGGGSL